jgi:hypothetical protein
MTMNTQKELIKKLAKLIEKNPDLEIKVCVDNHTLCDEWYAWTEQRIIDVKIELWFNTGDRILTDEDEIYTYFYEDVAPEGLTEKEAHEFAEKKCIEEIQKVIAIFTSV